jgi:plasmid stabilization system protein ParE
MQKKNLINGKKEIKVRWTLDALASLKDVYNFYKKKSLQGAQNVKKDIFNCPKRLVYPEQYQIDEIN